eukprot:TRINITY_DN27546_c0_g1_i1.p1 TRINITY_DN27546_c0_g1~~TRINITY_DN27546_c0_g1_i1.p1  ORF type:complete len:506 (-),score=38.94 TRINITY_DN27546_c0_g1_i1:357-1874(-)
MVAWWPLHFLCCWNLVTLVAGRANWKDCPWRSQFGQDRWLVEHAFRSQKGGFFVEAGAADGDLYSNTYALEHGLGWKGLLIEPTEDGSCARNRPASKCVKGCVHKETGVQTFQVNGLLTKLVEESEKLQANSTEVVQAMCRPMSDWLTANGAPSHIDYMSLDIEGCELDVLPTLLSDNRFHIDIFTIETNSQEVSDRTTSLLRQHGYFYIHRTGVDSVFFKLSDAEGCSSRALHTARKLWDAVAMQYPTSEHRLLRAWIRFDIKTLTNFTRRFPPRLRSIPKRQGCTAGAFSLLLAQVFSPVGNENHEERVGSGEVWLDVEDLNSYMRSRKKWSRESFFPLPPLRLPLLRLNFTSVLVSDWPIFTQIGLIAESVAHIKIVSDFRLFGCNRRCTSDKGSITCSDLEAKRWSAKLTASHTEMGPWFEICGGLQEAGILLESARLEAGASLHRTRWQDLVQVAETILKGLMLRYTPYAVLQAGNSLSHDSNPWVLLHKLHHVVKSLRL